MTVLINFVTFQICWFACILGGANGLPWAGLIVTAAAVAYHLRTSAKPGAEAALIGAAAIMGAVWDSGLVAAGWLVYPSGMLIDGTAPYWIVALWIAFATTLNVSLRWLKGRLVLAAALGAIAGPLAYFGGAKLGGVTFVDPAAGLTALAAGWAVMMPLLMVLSNRLDGFGESQLQAPASAVARN